MALIDNPKAVKRIVKGVLSNENQTDIARDLGVDRVTISRSLAKPQLKALIEKTYNQIAELSPYVHAVYEDEITRAPVDNDDRKLRLSAARDIAGITGISPIRDSRSSLFLTQIFAPGKIEVHPVVERVLERLGIGKQIEYPEGQPDYIDADEVR